ncbi:hypothetical protein G4B88_007110 [Cannabis sativa]|uniref:glycerophosphodiester phosphodiesterase n=1 Tax=Cannabis sativa TaxID=3483 RepID=A0A7J6GNG8_CANSA|nr:hypothetical protein G4B88_007110 [Cannabis sativa]
MCNARPLLSLCLLLSLVLASVSVQPQGPWLTLNGKSPVVIAHGGFSGIFPDSSYAAYKFTSVATSPNTVLWCDVQLTKDGIGICFPDIRLDNGTDINEFSRNKPKTYLVNGKSITGWFPLDYKFKQLSIFSVRQGVFSRTNKFDGNAFSILSVDQMIKEIKPKNLWLNIQHDSFFTKHNLSMTNFVLSLSERAVINYISSPEMAFLNNIKQKINTTVTKLVFRFPAQNEVDPSSNRTYDFFLRNLKLIKTFASGIIVPKSYIWPTNTKSYLLPHTSLVLDAHKEGLEVYASEFMNDVPLSYNYSHDPVAEYLNFFDNGKFSVDGVLSDFPITPSAAIECFAHLGNNATKQAKPLVISKCGASGDYPGCTDKAYAKAINDGVDVLDCPVQLSKDGIPFCLTSINLLSSTNVANSSFSNFKMSVPQIIENGTGIFSFNLTWDDVQKLKPVLLSPYSSFTLYRNPANINEGRFVSLSDFLAIAKNSSSLTGIMISIEHAPYLAEELSLSVTDTVDSALSKAGFDKQTALKVMIQSTHSSVLKEFQGKNNYELVYRIDEQIRSFDDLSLKDIKKFAHSVTVDKSSIYPDNMLFLTGATDVVKKIHSHKLPVYVQTFSNEFVSQAWDFLSDPTVEINSYVMGAKVDGIITEFPKTTARYRSNRCLGLGDNTPPYMSPVEPGSLMELITPPYMPPAESPDPVLVSGDVVEPPLSSV